ncbi:MAG TPA: endonuclease/exonuclease/phosphatase family protein [Rhizobiaceae bacterium]|nr:endonuclease/exonuclease/phosphatase family protein [Rhizobiaceae bacterium]
MKCVSYNIQYGIGRDGKYDLARIVDALQGADIIGLQEVTRNFFRNAGVDMVTALVEAFPDHFYVFGPAMDLDLGERDANGRPANKRFQFGNMLLSRWPIHSSRNLLLPRSRTYDRINLQRSALEGLIPTPLGPIRFYSVHLDHISHAERMMQIRHLKERVLAYPLEGGGVTGAVEFDLPELPCPEEFVLMGDFNMRPGREDYELMVGAPDSVFGRRLVAHDPVDVSRLVGEPPEGSVTWRDPNDPSKYGRIDYAFVSASLASRVKSAWIDGDAAGSDHQPVWFELA